MLCLLGASGWPAGAGSQEIYLQCLTNFETYAETVWHTHSAPDSGYWGDGVSTGNAGIRGNSGVAVAYATLVVAQPDHPNTSHRLDRIRQALNYNHHTHVTGSYNTTSGNQWGWSGASGDWQTPLWSGSMGLACILVQSHLPAATVQGIRRVIVSEADHRAAIAPASGYIGDTKAEENGWQANVLALAAAWMSTSNNAPTWLLAAKKYLANTYTVADTRGDPLASWVTTTTLYPSFALENHGFYHPTYQMVAGMSAGDSLLMARRADPDVAAQLQPFAEHNVMAVWSNNMSFVTMESGETAYPSSVDWSLHDYEHNSYLAWIATHFDDPLARYADERLAHLVRYRQQVNGDGRFVGPALPDGFYREAVEARRTAIAWLHHQFADHPSGPTTAPGDAVGRFADAKILTHRSASGFVGISYGARVMGYIEPAAAGFPSNVFISTPMQGGLFGGGPLGSATGATLTSLVTNAGGFTAELLVLNGTNGSTRVSIRSTGESVALIEVSLPAPGVGGTTAGCFGNGIQNDPLTGSTRLIEWTGGSTNIASFSGTTVNIPHPWVCVSGRHGLAAGPAGSFRYKAATAYHSTMNAAQDTVVFLPQAVLSPRYAVWFPGKTAAQTAALASQISWVTNEYLATLTFPGPGGSPVHLTGQISLPYPPYELGIAQVTASSYQSAYPPTNAVDNSNSTFWVSQYGPTNHAEWLKVSLPRPAAVSGFQIAPRLVNSGYGPSTFQMFCNVTDPIPASGIPNTGTPFWSGTGFALSTLDVNLPQPVSATNVVLVVTGAYDNGATNAPRNVQLVELNLFERALPGTFADWQLHQFTDDQLSDPAIGTATADPEADGVANLMEFVVVASPFSSDATNAVVRSVWSPPEGLVVQFQERQSLGDVVRQFQSSSDLMVWSNTVPTQLNAVQTNGGRYLYQAVFPAEAARQFFRLQYQVGN